MGVIIHNAIVVTGTLKWDRGDSPTIKTAHDKATALGLLVSPVVACRVNGEGSFFVAPDGSKEGWELSYEFDTKREAFRKWLHEHDEAGWFDWIEVRFGPDLGGNYIPPEIVDYDSKDDVEKNRR